MRRLFLLSLLSILWLFLPQASLALVVSPPVLSYSAKPGDAIIDVVKLFNDSDAPVTVQVLTRNAEDSGDEVGTPVFYPAQENRDGKALATWFAFEKEPYVIPARGTFSQPFTINVPTNAQPGGHYGALLFSTTSLQKGSGVKIKTEVAALVLIDVAGEKIEQASIASFVPVAPQEWYEHLPDGFLVRVENEGTTHIKPVGGVTITNMLGGTTAYLPINEQGGNILPQTIRRFEVDGPGDDASPLSAISQELRFFGLGKYTAKVALVYGENREVAEQTYVFYIWPWRTLSIAGGVLVFLLLLSALFRRKRKIKVTPLSL